METEKKLSQWDTLRGTLKTNALHAKEYVLIFLKWLLIATLTGAVGGFVGLAFHKGVEIATELRGAHPWLLWLLPVGGVLIALMYRFTKMEDKGTNTIIKAVQSGEKVPPVLVPVIFVGTIVTHLLGGSAGREGAALQIGGGIGSLAGRVFRLDENDMKLATMCGMSALFSALFGTPLTATVFVMEVISVGRPQYTGLVPCLVSALVAFGITQVFHVAPEHFVVVAETLSLTMVLKIVVFSVLCAVLSIILCEVFHGTAHLCASYAANPYVRAIFGGAIIIVLTFVVGSYDYNGAGMGVIAKAIEEGVASPTAFIWKLIFTAVTLGCGFRGGEVVPTFFVGATFGCVIGPLLGIPAGFAAAVGLTAVFCGAVNCPIASIFLAIELFGAEGLLYYALACVISYMLSGYFSLYSAQRITMSKLRAEYINIHANEKY